MNILIAEDEKDIRNLIKLNLEQEGYTVFASNDGLKALEIIRSQDIHLGIFDVMMPQLDGLICCARYVKRVLYTYLKVISIFDQA